MIWGVLGRGSAAPRPRHKVVSMLEKNSWFWFLERICVDVGGRHLVIFGYMIEDRETHALPYPGPGPEASRVPESFLMQLFGGPSGQRTL